MFQPKYLKRGKLLHKAVTRFLNYKRDLLPQAKLDEINGLRTELEKSIKARDEKRIDSLSDEINRACDRALPQARTGWFAENVEVFFVSIVIALGIRAYIAQPFQIPTGSMQPTLNGIRAETTAVDPNPGIVGKFLGIFTGTKYINAISDHDGYLDMREPITEHTIRFWRTYCKLHFTDGHVIEIDAPMRQLIEDLQLPANLRASTNRSSEDTPDMRSNATLRRNERIHIQEGQILARGILKNGDHVIVNKFAYHFRQPRRGEVFVFTTKNIDGINIPAEQGSQHYIKRLGGVPGDTVDIHPPELLHNGKPAVEPGFRRVIDNSAGSPHQQGYYGYQGYSLDHRIELPITLAKEPRREYFALGDNSYNSSDGRYWGTVPEQNLIGPGMFCYWPLTSHFGFIH
ncbi:MAG: signal peptidase I, partial [Verrucomicrobia bacterium]|nr:signal peptidase I [Verrucomicrobiota bacterium]